MKRTLMSIFLMITFLVLKRADATETTRPDMSSLKKLFLNNEKTLQALDEEIGKVRQEKNHPLANSNQQELNAREQALLKEYRAHSEPVFKLSPQDVIKILPMGIKIGAKCELTAIYTDKAGNLNLQLTENKDKDFFRHRYVFIPPDNLYATLAQACYLGVCKWSMTVKGEGASNHWMGFYATWETSESRPVMGMWSDFDNISDSLQCGK
jgi:hypothetical protein